MTMVGPSDRTRLTLYLRRKSANLCKRWRVGNARNAALSHQVGAMHGSDDQVKLQRLKEALLSETDQQKRSALKREIVLTEALLRFGRASPEE